MSSWKWLAGAGVLPLIAALLLLALLAGGAFADPRLPTLSGRVVDQAEMLSSDEEASITAQLAALEEKSSDQLVVVTLDSLQGYSIEEFGLALGRTWQIGQKGKDNGVLLIVAPKDRRVRIEVGYGLEGVLTDTLAGNIVHNRILPLFRAGQMNEGISTGVTDIIDTLTGDAAAVAERAAGERRVNEPDGVTLLILAFWGLLFFGGIGHSLFATSTGRGGVIIVPHAPASGRWSGGGSSGGGSGGGGFSGGGGSFGGGGSSGGW